MFEHYEGWVQWISQDSDKNKLSGMSDFSIAGEFAAYHERLSCFIIPEIAL